MNGTISDVIVALRRQWGEVYVMAHDNVALTEEIQAKLAEIETNATRMLTFATVCGYVAFVLAIAAATILIYQRVRKERI